MEKQKDIPCANCPSWKRKEKMFSCNPDDCKILTAWFFNNAPKLKDGIQLQAHIPEVAMQYVV